MKKMLAFIFVISSFYGVAQASGAPQTGGEYCAQVKNQEALQERMKDSRNHLSFTNIDGPLGIGVCWWHSRFTRNALYVAVFLPDEPMMNEQQMRLTVKAIRDGNRAIGIPGFKNLRDFSRHPVARRLIEEEIGNWQLTDGFIYQQWVVGLSGRHETTPEDLAHKMHDLYRDVKVNKNIVYQKQQMEPFGVNHSWLVYDMEATSNGYDITFHDSNYYGTYSISYTYGDTSLQYAQYPFVPYTENQRELDNLKSVMTRFCQQ